MPDDVGWAKRSVPNDSTIPVTRRDTIAASALCRQHPLRPKDTTSRNLFSGYSIVTALFLGMTRFFNSSGMTTGL
jgi:hypothetical protein